MKTGEFDLIEGYFASLSGEGAFGLKNDAALLAEQSDSALIVTMDTLVEGVHFFASDPPSDVARKLLRVNLSDLAAMGAGPVGYTLSAAYSAAIDENWVKAFTEGLAADQNTFGLSLLGGDTTRTPGPLTLTVTCFGRVPGKACLRRDTALEGEDIWVSGTLGDAAAGLALLKGANADVAEDDHGYLIDRYRVPQPRLALGRRLLVDGYCRTAMDISDGLLGDLAHITEASGVGARLTLSAVPLSPSLQALPLSAQQRWELACGGGDDYELLFTAPEDKRGALLSLCRELDIPLSRIGKITAGSGIVVEDDEGSAVSIKHQGWRHF